MNWLVLGSSALAPASLAYAKANHRVDRIVTTNRGILLEPRPDVYILNDGEACRRHLAAARRAHETGTHCVTLRRMPQALKARGVEWFDEFVSENGDYEPFQLSGLWALEYACRHGAARCLLCGMDGYSPDIADEMYFHTPYADEADNAAIIRKNHTKSIIEPKTEVICWKYPTIIFTLIGTPQYQVKAPNWEVVPCPNA